MKLRPPLPQVYWYMFFVSTFFLLTGTIGFFACFVFVQKIYSAIKVDQTERRPHTGRDERAARARARTRAARERARGAERMRRRGRGEHNYA